MLDVEPSSFSASGDQEFTLSLETKLKEPSMPKAPENYIKLLCDYQHLGKSDWNEIRYSETQKLYNYSPGYTDIEMNEEVKAFESPRHLVHADKAFAALTMCVLKQRDALQGTLQELLQWARGNSVSLSYDTLLQKVSDLFSTGDYSRCSSDLLQIICGHRAEILQMRRDCVTKQAKDPLMKASLKKIPPTCSNLSNAEKFTAAIEKSGGVRKCFWPLQKGNTSSASQTDPNRFRGPSQGSKPYNKSLQGFSRNAQACQHITTHSQCVGSDPPSQGGCSHSNPPPQGDSNPRGHAAQYNSVAPNNRSNFRGRPMLGKIINRGMCENAHYLPSGITTIKDVSIDSFRAGRLLHFADQWKQMNAPKFILNIISGYRIPFCQKPPLVYPNLVRTNLNVPESVEMTSIINKMLVQGILERG
ncbi:hypothetical protein HF086_015493 [Spodoptera exigua]|uniref:Uncharacterized protein n=1 Tax=Spodoptera exigua TaxID=7107 RepID=A0A922SFY8_SPOEX|nr:hypothetical protein HF086_015493 [Spodoptera exigua]